MSNDKILEKDKHILFCNCGGSRIETDIFSSVDEHLRKMPVGITKLSDLCGLVAKKKEVISELINRDTEILVIGCYSRTMNLLFDQIRKDSIEFTPFNHINLIESTAEKAIEEINNFCAGYDGNSEYQEIAEDSGWPSWYPVIDYSRCTACGQCSDFCLFGVYENDGKEVKVINPEGCKNNCPACGRICPATAIIFPKYKYGGAIGGSEDIDEQAEQQRQAKDVENFLGNDIYAALERRKAKRRSIIREEAMKKALDERSNAMNDTSKSK